MSHEVAQPVHGEQEVTPAKSSPAKAGDVHRENTASMARYTNLHKAGGRMARLVTRKEP